MLGNKVKGTGNREKDFGYRFTQIEAIPELLNVVAKPEGGHITIEGKAYTVTPEVDGLRVKRAEKVSRFEAFGNFFLRLFSDGSFTSRASRLTAMATEKLDRRALDSGAALMKTLSHETLLECGNSARIDREIDKWNRTLGNVKFVEPERSVISKKITAEAFKAQSKEFSDFVLDDDRGRHVDKFLNLEKSQQLAVTGFAERLFASDDIKGFCKGWRAGADLGLTHITEPICRRFLEHVREKLGLNLEEQEAASREPAANPASANRSATDTATPSPGQRKMIEPAIIEKLKAAFDAAAVTQKEADGDGYFYFDKAEKRSVDQIWKYLDDCPDVDTFNARCQAVNTDSFRGEVKAAIDRVVAMVRMAAATPDLYR